LWVAKDAGIYERNGLDVDLTVTPGTQAMAALLSGQVQLIQTGGSAALSPSAGGADLEVVSVVIPVFPYVLITSPEVKTAADLKGKKLGVSSLGDSVDIATRVAVSRLGLDPEKDVSILAMGGGSTVLTAALQGGSIQGAALAPPGSIQLPAQGYNALLDLAAQKAASAEQSVVVTRSYATANRPVVQKYVDSMVQSVAKLKADKPFTINVLKKWLKSDDEPMLSAIYDFYAGEVYASNPEPKPELFQDAVTQLVNTNPQLKGFDVSKILDPSFARSAIGRGLEKAQ
jgi:NitT/TauT family transport system substrate-binding protein